MTSATAELSHRSPTSTPPRRRNILRKAVPPVAAIVGLVALWWVIVAVFSIPKYIVPSPLDVLGSFQDDYSTLLANLWPTVLEAVFGFLAGNIVAIALAVIFVHWKTAERAFFPVAVFIRTVPIVAIAPILVVILGYGYSPKIIIAALISFFPTLVNMVRGLQAVDKQSLELLRVLSASRREVFFKVRIFASLPYLFSALKIAATSSVIGAIVAEWVGSQQGLGYLIIQATYNFQVPLLWATMIVASIFATLFFAVIGIIEKLVVTWDAKEAA
ncbi:ABC transporter permease [Nakamurella lactea]|uniref:ABC transporter permease n=1 Tax=Nakamurella lactea TaxID=459515 RepID=UPI00041DD241|nr:ABC transporter permease [Nakamurella lactea]